MNQREWRTEPMGDTDDPERARDFLYVVGPKEHNWVPPFEWLFHADDAHLIAAAPDLYEALDAIIKEMVEHRPIGPRLILQAGSALLKARGDRQSKSSNTDSAHGRESS